MQFCIYTTTCIRKLFSSHHNHSNSTKYASPIPPSRKEKYCIKDFPLFLPVGVCQNSKLSQIFLTYSSQWFHLSQNFILLSQIISDVIWKDWFVSKFDFSKIWFISSVRFIISRLWLRSSNNWLLISKFWLLKLFDLLFENSEKLACFLKTRFISKVWLATSKFLHQNVDLP